MDFQNVAHGIVSWIVVPRYEACRSVALQIVILMGVALRGMALRSVTSKYSTSDKKNPFKYDFEGMSLQVLHVRQSQRSVLQL